MTQLRLTILGCGSSGGVPRLGARWGNCDPANPKNRRRRCSLLVEQISEMGVTRVLIDTSPDLRAQLLDADVAVLDAVLYTHPHADHVHGIDDLRQIVFNRKSRLPVWADEPTSADLLKRFDYVFTQPEGSLYPPILDLNRIGTDPVEISGAGGTIPFQPIRVEHGTIPALAFRIHDIVYLPDVSAIPEAVFENFLGLDLWILDALRYEPHYTHAHLDLSLEWIARAAPKQAILTNMHIELDYARMIAETPPNVQPAYDGMVVEFDI